MNVTMVVGDTGALTSDDTTIRDHFTNVRGDTVTLINNAAAVPADTDLLVLMRSVGASSSAGADYSGEDVPVLCLGRGFTVNMGYGTGATAHGSGVTSLRPAEPEHPVHGGFYPDDVTVLSSAANAWRYPSGAPASVVTRWFLPFASANPIVFTVDEGSSLLDSKTAIRNHSAWFFENDGDASNLTADGFVVLDALIDWAAPDGGGATEQLDTPQVTVDATSNPTTVGGEDGTIDASWPAVDNADTYRVEIADGHGATSGFSVVEESHPSTSIQIGDLSAGEYTVGVTAKPAP